jgi:cytochrome b561
MTTTTRYPIVSIILHWAMLLLIAAVYAAIELREFFPKGSGIREGFKTWHFMLGLTVLTLVVVRIVVRLLSRSPPIMPTPPKWQTLASRATHVALYALMIGMPLAGWMILSAKGLPVRFYGAELPPLMAPDKAVGDWIKEIHETAGTVGYWLIGFHAAAALAHHYFWKDNTLRRMLISGS